MPCDALVASCVVVSFVHRLKNLFLGILGTVGILQIVTFYCALRLKVAAHLAGPLLPHSILVVAQTVDTYTQCGV